MLGEQWHFHGYEYKLVIFKVFCIYSLGISYISLPSILNPKLFPAYVFLPISCCLPPSPLSPLNLVSVACTHTDVHPLSMGYLPWATPLKESNPPSSSRHKLPFHAQLGGGVLWALPSPCWDADWLDLVQVLCRQPQLESSRAQQVSVLK